MPAESSHHRTRPKKYTIVILPTDESGTPKRITLGKFGFFMLGMGIFVLAVAVVLGALVYTPIGVYLPIPNPELENRYHKQIVAIQDRLTQLTEDLAFLREYNVRLRKALGETLSPEDSVFIAAHPLAPGNEQRATTDINQENVQRGRLFGVVSDMQLDAGQTSSYVVKAVQVELPLTLPVQGYITQEFNPDQQHFGIDFAGKVGSSIYAAADGSVIFSGWTYDDGYMIIMAHGSGYRTTYKHNQALLKSAGEFVRRGEPIALLGNSGRTSYGPHLHFEVWKDGAPLNPKELLLTLP